MLKIPCLLLPPFPFSLFILQKKERRKKDFLLERDICLHRKQNKEHKQRHKMVFGTLAQSETVLNGLREAAMQVKAAVKTKDGTKMAKVLDILKDLQVSCCFSTHETPTNMRSKNAHLSTY